MKIAITCFNLGWLAGGPRLIFEQARGMQKLGHKVVIYAPDFDSKIYPQLSQGLDIRTVRFGKPIFGKDTSNSILKRIQRKFGDEHAQMAVARAMADALDADTDVLNCHDTSYRIAPLYKERNPKGKVLWTMHEPPFGYLPKSDVLYDILSRLFNWWRNISIRKYFKFIDAVVVVNERNAEWVRSRGLKVGIVRPGVESDQFYGPVKPRRAGDKKVSILCVGAPNKYRRFEDTIRAVGILRQEGYDARVTVLGKNIWNENEYCEFLKSIARDGGFADRATFRFEGVDEKELVRIYHESDVFTLMIHLPPPRNGYGWQLTGFEAMAAGLPVVISRRIDSVEMLEDGVTALFVDPESPGQVAERIKWLVDHPAEYAKIAAAGQKLVREKLTWEQYARGLLDLVG